MTAPGARGAPVRAHRHVARELATAASRHAMALGVRVRRGLRGASSGERGGEEREQPENYDRQRASAQMCAQGHARVKTHAVTA